MMNKNDQSRAVRYDRVWLNFRIIVTFCANLKATIFLSVCPICLLIFFLFFSTNEPEFCAGIDPGMVLNVDHFHLVFWTRFKPTTFTLWVKFANHLTGLAPVVMVQIKWRETCKYKSLILHKLLADLDKS
jgi:hypothetical protein